MAGSNHLGIGPTMEGRGCQQGAWTPGLSEELSSGALIAIQLQLQVSLGTEFGQKCHWRRAFSNAASKCEQTWQGGSGSAWRSSLYSISFERACAFSVPPPPPVPLL